MLTRLFVMKIRAQVFLHHDAKYKMGERTMRHRVSTAGHNAVCLPSLDHIHGLQNSLGARQARTRARHSSNMTGQIQIQNDLAGHIWGLGRQHCGSIGVVLSHHFKRVKSIHRGTVERERDTRNISHTLANISFSPIDTDSCTHTNRFMHSHPCTLAPSQGKNEGEARRKIAAGEWAHTQTQKYR